MARPWLIASGVVALLACVTVAEHLEFARAIYETAGDAGALPPGPGALPGAGSWWLTFVVSAAVGGTVIPALLRSLRDARRREPTVPGTGDPLRRLQLAAAAAVVAWLLWQLVNAIAAPASASWPWLHTIAVALTVAALALIGPALPPGSLAAWQQAAVVRAQLLVLGALAALVFLVPFTGVQVEELLRAWTDGHLVTAVTGVALALALGAVVRASTIRLIDPAGPEEQAARWGGRGRRVVAVAFLALAALTCVLLRAELGGLVLALGAGILAATEWAEPEHNGVPVRRQDVWLSRGVPRALGAVPLAILFVSLVASTSDSYLLPDSAGTGQALAMTVAVGLLLVVLLADVQRAPGQTAVRAQATAPGDRPGRPAALVTLALGTCGAALAAGLLPPEVKGPYEAVWALPLLALAGAASLRAFGERGGAELALGCGLLAGMTAAVYIEPVEAPRAYGAFAVALGGALAVMLVLYAAGSVGAARAPRFAKDVLPRRIPVLALLAAWIAGAVLFAAGTTTHHARLVAGEAPTERIADAVHDWLDREAEGRTGSVPMVLVGASGGGAKAAYWTDLVIDCMLGSGSPSGEHGDECPASGVERERLGRVFLTSSVSGGSAGVFHLVTRRAQAEAGERWVDDAAGPELLSPLAAWGLFHDLPVFLGAADTDPRKCSGTWCRRHANRAVVQEAALAGLEDGMIDEASVRPLAHDPSGPVTVFNAARDGGDGRVLIAALQLAPPRPANPNCELRPAPGEPAAASFDLGDTLADRTVPLATAALLSARFPAVAPAGTIEVERDRTECAPPRTLKLRDGGYMENTGLLTIVELIPEIRAAIAEWKRDRDSDVEIPLVVVSIDDDSEALDGDARLTEPRRDLSGIGKTAGPAYLSRLARDRLTAGAEGPVRYVRISPPPHPGAKASTGWTISPIARRHDLGTAVAAPPQCAEIDALRDELDRNSDAAPTSGRQSACRVPGG